MSSRIGSYRYLGGIGGIRHQVLAGVGVAVLPRYFIESDLAAGALVERLPGTQLGSDWFRLVWRADHPRERELELLADELRQRPLT
jgi:DNA-binding transcriptional LysR family regulator